MLIKVGRTYQNHLGELIAIVKCREDSEIYPFLDANGQSYTKAGKFCGSIDSNKDLVAEVVGLDTCPSYWVINPCHPKQEKETKMSLQLEVGKTYKDREGNLVTITCKKDFECIYPYTGDNESTYMPDGRFREYDMYHDLDLIEEVSTTPMFGTTWTFPNFKQVVGVPTFTEEAKMQDQIVAINCTLVVRDIEGTLTLQVHPKDEFWRADESTTVLDSNFELVLPKAKVEELYTERLLAKVQKADKEYKEALEAFESAKTFIDNL